MSDAFTNRPPDPDRRTVLRAMGTLGALACVGPSASGAGLVSGADAVQGQRVLVLLQLSGGNDGLSTLVPYAEDGYQRARKRTRFTGAEQLLALNDHCGLHPALLRLREQYDAGRMAIVQGVGYPSPNRSHFKSLEIWHTADLRGKAAGDGWVGRMLDGGGGALGALGGGVRSGSRVVHVGARAPWSVHSSTRPADSFAVRSGFRLLHNDAEVLSVTEGLHGPRGSRLAGLRRMLGRARAASAAIQGVAERYRPRVAYPDDPFADALRVCAAMIHGRLGARVISLELGGFDTHSNQRQTHDVLMGRLDACLGAFLADLSGTAVGSRTCVLAFSEFGRRVAENGSRGTDHGAAGPLFILGEGVRGGLHGSYPSLDELDDGDLVHTIDFRSVYASVARDWFGVDPACVLSEQPPSLELFQPEQS